MATKPSDEEIDAIWHGARNVVLAECFFNTIQAAIGARRAVWNAGYAAGLKDAREACAKLATIACGRGEYELLADAIAKLENEQ